MILERRPGPAVGAHVVRYCAYEERTDTPVRQREPMSTGVVLIFGIDSKIGVDGERLGTFVGGLGDRCQWIEHDGAMAGIQVDLTPLGARMLLGVPMHELARRSVPLEDILGPDAVRIEEQLHGLRTWDERIDLLDHELARRLASAEAPPPDVSWAWRTLSQTDGRTRVGALTSALGCSGRHLAARFRDHVGLPPKLVARTMRFTRAAQMLGDASLDEVAFACGYYDQSHLDRDFREFAGATPTTYRDDPREVTFFQDA